MKLLDRLKTFWNSFFSKGSKSSTREITSLLAKGSGFGSFSGAWTDSRIELVRHFRHWVFIAIDRIGSKIGVQVPNITLVRTDEDRGNPEKYINPYLRSKALTPVLSHENLEPVKPNHPLVRLLREPNESDTAYDLWYETVMFLYLTGSAYWWIPKNKLGLPIAIWVLPSHWVWPIIGHDKLIDEYEIRPVEGNYLKKTIPAEDVIHFRFKSPLSKIDGYSPQTAVNHWIDTQESVDRSRFFTFRNGVQADLAIQFSGELHDLNESNLNQIEAKFFNRYQGETRAGKPIILPPGVTLKNLFVSPREFAYCESAEQLRDNILAAFGVPASIAQVSNSMTYGSVLATQAGFYSVTINPLCRQIGQVITEKLAHRFDPRLRVWWEDATPDDPEMIEKRIKTDSMTGAITPCEIRALRGREAYPFGGTDPLIPGNMAITPWVTGGEYIAPLDTTVPKDQEESKENE